MSVISNTIQIFTAVSKSLTAGVGKDILYWSVIHLNIKCSKCISRKRKWKDGWTLVDNIYILLKTASHFLLNKTFIFRLDRLTSYQLLTLYLMGGGIECPPLAKSAPVHQGLTFEWPWRDDNSYLYIYY